VSGHACDDCLRRTALIASLSGWIDVQWKRRDAVGRLLALPDEVLLELAADPRVVRAHAGFDPAAARARVAQARLRTCCRCSAGYPELLRDLPDPPAVLHVLGDPAALRAPDAVAIVGARRASGYGAEVARALGRGLGVAGVPVVSGLAYGIDASAHAGALAGTAGPVAVVAGGADRPYPASSRRLHEQVGARGAVVSELPPGTGVRRWAFPARNRIIAGLARVVVVVEAAERSGSLITADLATDAGRTVGAVPGRVTTPVAAGTNGLLAAGAAVVRGVEDVLDLLADCGFRHAAPPARELPAEPELRALLAAIDDGRATLAALAREQPDADAVVQALAELEARGLVRRGFGGRYVRAL
jgi:DNA processing protein